jgi:hypothetical protein
LSPLSRGGDSLGVAVFRWLPTHGPPPQRTGSRSHLSRHYQSYSTALCLLVARRPRAYAPSRYLSCLADHCPGIEHLRHSSGQLTSQGGWVPAFQQLETPPPRAWVSWLPGGQGSVRMVLKGDSQYGYPVGMVPRASWEKRGRARERTKGGVWAQSGWNTPLLYGRPSVCALKFKPP